MGERLLCKQEVIGSIPFTSTTVAAQRRLSASRQQSWRPRQRRKRRCATFGEDRDTVPGRGLASGRGC